MSERAFFSLRYALPGYTFILMVVLVAYPALEKRFLFGTEQVTLVAAFLAFLSLLGGGALGFLVSQVWYVVFNTYIMGNYEKIPDMIEMLAKKYGLVRDRYHRIVFVDYVYRLNRNKDLRYIVERRYDLMHLSGSTLVLTVSGSLFGVWLRVYLCNSYLIVPTIMISGFVLFTLFNLLIRSRKSSSFEPEILLSLVPPILLLFLVRVTVYDIGVFLIVAILGILLFYTFQHAKKLHAMPFEISVKEVVYSQQFPVWKAKRVFPEHYFVPTPENQTD